MAERLKHRLRRDLNQAPRARDRVRTLVLSTAIAELKNHETENGRDASGDDVVAVRARAIKRRREASEQMGAVMRRIMPRIEGRFDGRDANRIVREELAP